MTAQLVRSAQPMTTIENKLYQTISDKFFSNVGIMLCSDYALNKEVSNILGGDFDEDIVNYMLTRVPKAEKAKA